MRTRRGRKRPEKQNNFKTRLLNQTIVCIMIIISVVCFKSVNDGSALIKSIRETINTSVDYKSTAENIKNMFTRLLNEGEKLNDTENKEQSVTPDSNVQTL